MKSGREGRRGCVTNMATILNSLVVERKNLGRKKKSAVTAEESERIRSRLMRSFSLCESKDVFTELNPKRSYTTSVASHSAN